MSWILGAVVLAGGLAAARLSPDDPLGEALAQVLHKVNDLVEPTITCTPQDDEFNRKESR